MPDKTRAARPADQAMTRPEAIAAILAASDERASRETAPFVTGCLARVEPEDLAAYDDSALAAALVHFAQYGAQRAPGERKVRVYNPALDVAGYSSANTVIEAIGIDMPFLLDSTLAELNRRSLAIRALWHPIVRVTRDARGRRTALGVDADTPGAIKESMIRVEIDRLALPERLQELADALRTIYADVVLAVRDWRPMLARLEEVMGELKTRPPRSDPAEIEEAVAFLQWLKADHFTFLGCRDYVLKGEGGEQTLEMIPQSGVGVLTDPARRIVRRGEDRTSLPPELRAFLNEPSPLIITKSNTRSSVHRRVHMDYIGVKRFDPEGRIVGERRFVGLFTSAAYTRNTREIPLLRRKVARALALAGFDAASHDGKAYLNILETFPRDELFQISDEEFLHTTLGILRLQERPRTRVFVRWDQFDRFVSVLVFVPRERYSTELRQRIMDILVETFDGRPSAYYPNFGDEPLARIHYIVGRTVGPRPVVDVADLEARVAQAARSFDDDLEEAACARYGEEQGTRLFMTGRNAFGAGYREAFGVSEALVDLETIEAMKGEAFAARLFKAPGDGLDTLRVKLYHAGGRMVLSEVLPVLERLGLRIVQEQSYPLALALEQPLVIHEFLMQEPTSHPLNLDGLKEIYEDALGAILRGVAESDGLNRLVVRAGLGYRDITILRMLARYLRQAAIPYSQEYMEDALGNNPALARAIVALFHARLNPKGPADRGKRESAIAAVRAEIEKGLESVNVLDEDRILRRFVNAVDSILRTSFYQKAKGGGDKATVAIKLDSRALLDLPAPRPMVEIFVYSPRVEGVHLRFGKVARGGLRWSDRREDFRTEILGLIKAQRVKNAVIVPVGAKGGFVLKQLSPDAPRETVQAEGVECYKLFVSALLAITDNLKGDAIVPPADVVRWDGDDPYLVVAADKGTATFSDIANGLSLEHGFWLGDAFASGGSQGYDHKKMGITARGAWEAVKRHFRERNVDIQATPFTVMGVGDMSGDVFGNAMLLSRQIKLVAAFDHRDIFIDPTPEPAQSFAERARLFALARSSWADYDKALISRGGGVFSRKLKAIPLSAEMKALTGLSGESVAPTELMRALLKAPVDLLWFGGIGTYVKSASESHLDVGDRANDAIRIDGAEIRAKVVGEGANLGCTQRGRVDFARTGGRINTDAVDNSAGVDTSDHEVNIKILLNPLVAQRALGEGERNSLLTSMADEVAGLVLKNNYRQTLALTLSAATAARDVARHGRLMEALERQGVLDRKVERLPEREALAELEARGQGLTRPELAVLIAYAKITLYEALIHSGLPDERFFADDLAAYFPTPLRARFAAAISQHRLRREIIATEVANLVVNMAGPTFAMTVGEESGRPVDDVVRAFIVARRVFGLDRCYDAINALDTKIEADLQTVLHLEAKAMIRRQALWFLRQSSGALAIEERVAAFEPGARLLLAQADDVLSPFQRGEASKRAQSFEARGVPASLARHMALLEPLASACDVIAIAGEAGRKVDEAARAFFAVGQALGLDRLVVLTDRMKLDSHWEGLARGRLVDALARHQRAAAGQALGRDAKGSGGDAVTRWLEPRQRAVESLTQLVAEFETSGLTIAKLTVAESALSTLTR